MPTILTEHVRRAGAARGRCEATLPDEVLGAIRQLLQRQMRLRGLYWLPPELLGYPDVRRWSDAGAFDDIVVDCYIAVILERLASLHNQLRLGGNLDPLIVHNIGHFLAQRQRDTNPLGYAIYGNLRVAAREACSANLLTLDGLKNGRCAATTLLRFVGAGQTRSVDQATLRRHLEQMTGWSEALPGLVRTSQVGQAWLIDFLERLSELGVSAVRFGDLVNVVEAQARADWAQRTATPVELAAQVDDELVELIRIVQPDSSAEDRDQWRDLVSRVEEHIREGPQQERVRQRRLSIFSAIVRHAEEDSRQPIRQADLCRALNIAAAVMHGDVTAIHEAATQVIAQAKPE